MLVGKVAEALEWEIRRTASSFPFLARRRVLWSRSYYIGTVGHVCEATVRRYIENQRA